MKPRSLLLVLVTLFSLFGPSRLAFAKTNETYFDQLQTYGIVFAGICTDGQNGHSCPCRDSGECSLTDMMQVFVNISNFILAIVGSLVLLMTSYGAIRWLAAAGDAESVAAGTGAMRNSFIGLLIIFGAFTSINFLTGALRGGGAGQTNKCELVSPEDGGKAGLGYACLDTTLIDTADYTCESNLCPGDETIKCCVAKDSTSSGS